MGPQQLDLGLACVNTRVSGISGGGISEWHHGKPEALASYSQKH